MARALPPVISILLESVLLVYRIWRFDFYYHHFLNIGSVLNRIRLTKGNAVSEYQIPFQSESHRIMIS